MGAINTHGRANLKLIHKSSACLSFIFNIAHVCEESLFQWFDSMKKTWDTPPMCSDQCVPSEDHCDQARN